MSDCALIGAGRAVALASAAASSAAQSSGRRLARGAQLIARFHYPRRPLPPRRARYLLSQHPEVEARVVAELDALELLVTPRRPRPRALEWADLGRLTYLQAVIKVPRREAHDRD